MPNTYFQFKQFRVDQKKSGMKVTTDACLFGAWVADEIKKMNTQPARILDIGTGTGLLSLMLAQVAEISHIEAVEINMQAYEEATQNFKNSRWNDRLTCFHSTIQDFQPDKKYDLIICNPPFFKESQVSNDINKRQALHASTLSMDDLIMCVSRLLNKNGTFFLLYPKKEMKEFTSKAEKAGINQIWNITVRNQKIQQVFRSMGGFSLKKIRPINQEMAIRNTDKKYTAESWVLLKNYYLEYNDPQIKRQNKVV